MRRIATPLAGVWELAPEPREDERGFFARTWEAAALGAPLMAEASLSYNRRRGTLRGLHFQRAPHAEAKVVECTRGAIYDVVLDLRPASPTFKAWHAVELSAANRRGVYIPAGLAHGFLTLEDDTEVRYMISEPYAPAAAAGVRWNDPAFGIRWPFEPVVLAARDASYEDFGP
jgi:dTDP-4-dehydrorhamnose 3,5-epimerase